MASIKAQMMSQSVRLVVGRWYLAPHFDGHVCMGKSTDSTGIWARIPPTSWLESSDTNIKGARAKKIEVTT